jgi:hypothetical protein
MFKKTTEQRVAKGLKWAAAIGIFAGAPGCSPTNSTGPDPKAIDSAAAEFLQSTPGVAKIFQKPEAVALTHFRVEVLVDMTASMEGYVATTGNPVQGVTNATHNKKGEARPTEIVSSSFFDLLHQLANENELTEYLGFGSDKDGAVTTFMPFEKSPPMVASQYRRNNNDYADLLDQIAKRPAEADGEPIERIIITDGVQSHQDKGHGSALGMTVERLRAWVKKGGVVEMRLFTAPYSGTYYSEELRARNMHYSYLGKIESRPFLAISLISKRDDMPAWKNFWERDALSGLKQVAYLCYPAPQVIISGLTFTPEDRIPKDIGVPVLFRNVWDLSKIVTLDVYHDLWRAHVHRIQTQSDPRPPTYPACFLLNGMAPSADLEADLRGMNPVLQVWRHDAAANIKKNPLPPSPSPTTTALSENPNRVWENVEMVDLRDPNNGTVKIDRLAPPGTGFRFTATLPTPAKNDMRVVIAMAKPRGSKPPSPDWKAYSTLDDSSPANLNKIYNLQPFVEQLTSDEVTDPAPVATAVFTHR